MLKCIQKWCLNCVWKHKHIDLATSFLLVFSFARMVIVELVDNAFALAQSFSEIYQGKCLVLPFFILLKDAKSCVENETFSFR